MEVRLTVKERFMLLNLLPQRGTAATLRIVNDLSSRIGVSSEEAEAINLRQTKDGHLRWDTNSESTRTLVFRGFELKLIVERLQKISEEEELTIEQLPLWDKFVDQPEENTTLALVTGGEEDEATQDSDPAE